MRYLYGNNLGLEVKKLEPTHIMVAYIGQNWANFLSYSKIQNIIVNPDYPTNPYALGNLQQQIGAGKVRILDKLHAKVYLRRNNDSTRSAIIGSPNLTANGLGGHGLYEAAIYFDFDAHKEGDLDIFGSFNAAWENAEPLSEDRLERLKKDYQEKVKRQLSFLDCDGDFPLLVWYGQEAQWSGENPDIQPNIKAIKTLGVSQANFIKKIESSLDVMCEEDRNFLKGASGRLALYFSRGNNSFKWARVTNHFIKQAYYYTDDPDNLIDVCLTEPIHLNAPFDVHDPIFLKKFRALMSKTRFGSLQTDDDECWFTNDRLKLMKIFCKKLRKALHVR